jgi:hypothetical protein
MQPQGQSQIPLQSPQPAQQRAVPPGVQHAQPQVAKPPINPNSTQNSLQIAAIRDGIVIMRDGSFRAVVMAKSINFDLMSPAEQEAVEYAYQSFLNSLYFDIQIFMRSRKIDMTPYLDRLNKQRHEIDNMLLGMLMEDYMYFIDDLVQQTNIMSKQFYIVVPYFSQLNAGQAVKSSAGLMGGLFGGGNNKNKVSIDESLLEKAKTELKNRVQSIMNGLLQIGVQSMPLDTQELIELYYNAYNPDTATRQTLNNMNNLNVPITTKGVGQAPKPNIGGTL